MRVSYGDWVNFTDVETSPTFRDILTLVLQKTPADILDRRIPEGYLSKDLPFRMMCREPFPNFDDPLGQRGFVGYKFLYDNGEPSEGTSSL